MKNLILLAVFCLTLIQCGSNSMPKINPANLDKEIITEVVFTLKDDGERGEAIYAIRGDILYFSLEDEIGKQEYLKRENGYVYEIHEDDNKKEPILIYEINHYYEINEDGSKGELVYERVDNIIYCYENGELIWKFIAIPLSEVQELLE